MKGIDGSSKFEEMYWHVMRELDSDRVSLLTDTERQQEFECIQQFRDPVQGSTMLQFDMLEGGEITAPNSWDRYTVEMILVAIMNMLRGTSSDLEFWFVRGDKRYVFKNAGTRIEVRELAH